MRRGSPPLQLQILFEACRREASLHLTSGV